jgi:CrcB protein
MTYLLIALGGAVGALARFAVGGWIAQWASPAFPWGTLLVNLSGSVLLGFLMRAFPVWDASTGLRALLAVGFCGSFTTFSTFGYETVLLLQSGAYGMALAYALGSVVLGVSGVALGMAASGALA